MYKVYLSDGFQTSELDVEEIDFQSEFAISDLSDLSVRRDSIKTLNIKGTNNNNKVFGFFFDLSNVTDSNAFGNLFSVYSPIRDCTAFVYENSLLIYKGKLKLNKSKLVKNNLYYECIITSTMLDFKTQVQDKLLTDISFDDLRHRYTLPTIIQSWSGSTEIYVTTTSGFTSTPFEYGKNYVYPRVDYGFYSGETFTSNPKINIRNFKPSIYVNEYYNRIFGDINYSYEIVGNDLKDLFNKLVVVNTEEGTTGVFSGITTTANKPTVLIVNEYDANESKGFLNKIIPIQNITFPDSTIIGKLIDNYDVAVWLRRTGGLSTTPSLKVIRNFTSDGLLEATFQSMQNLESVPCQFHIQLVKRTLAAEAEFITVAPDIISDDYSTKDNRLGNWTVVGESFVTLQAGETKYNVSLKANIGINNFIEGETLAIQVSVQNKLPLYYNGYTIERGAIKTFFTLTDARIKLPNNSIIKADIIPVSGNTGFDTIVPPAPQNIKQFDFIKAIMKLLNLYAYSDTNNQKKIYFETYDSYYSRCSPEYLRLSAVDWSNKIDYNKDVITSSNISLPKSYLFTFKEDNDYLNKQYKDKFNQVYGNLSFSDKYGLLEQKKLDLIFSPLVVSTQSGSDMKLPLLYQLDNGAKKVSKSNIKLGVYNGLQPCQPYTIISAYSANTIYSGLTQYPEITNYYYSTGATQPHQDLHFNSPLEYYFTPSQKHIDASNTYSNYYINQISELTNQNVRTVELSVLLNEIDISNLSLKNPVYIQTGDYNGFYFKVISVKYEGRTSSSRVVLQRIVL